MVASVSFSSRLRPLLFLTSSVFGSLSLPPLLSCGLCFFVPACAGARSGRARGRGRVRAPGVAPRAVHREQRRQMMMMIVYWYTQEDAGPAAGGPHARLTPRPAPGLLVALREQGALVQAEQGLRHPCDLTPRAHGARGAGLRRCSAPTRGGRVAWYDLRQWSTSGLKDTFFVFCFFSHGLN